MKTIKYLSIAFLLSSACIQTLSAQDKEVKKGQMTLVIEEDKDGQVTKFDSTFSIEDKEKVEAILKARGIEWKADEIGTNIIRVDSDGENNFVSIDNKNVGDKEVKFIKVMQFDTEGEDGESQDINIEVIVDEAIKEAVEMSQEYKFTHEGGETKVFVVKKDVDGSGEDVDVKVNADGTKTVTVKKIVVEGGEEGELHELIMNNTMVFVIDTETDSKANKKGLPSKIEEEKLENLEISKLKLFPNPTNGDFNMSFKSNKAKDIRISITDAKGSEVYEKELKQFKGKFNEDFDLSNQEPGLYFFNIITGNEKETRKIIVQ